MRIYSLTILLIGSLLSFSACNLIAPYPEYKATPIKLSTLQEKIGQIRIDCIDENGVPIDEDNDGKTDQIFLVDEIDTLAFFDCLSGTIDLETTDWINEKPYVALLFDPNACGKENLANEEFSSGAILIRGAELTEKNELLLFLETDINDMNFLNIEVDGKFQQDFFGVDDSTLDQKKPNLAPTVNGMKKLILDLAQP